MPSPTITLKIADDGSEWTHGLTYFTAHNATNYLDSAPSPGGGPVTIEDRDSHVAYRMTAAGNVIADARQKRPSGPPPVADGGVS